MSRTRHLLEDIRDELRALQNNLTRADLELHQHWCFHERAAAAFGFAQNRARNLEHHIDQLETLLDDQATGNVAGPPLAVSRTRTLAASSPRQQGGAS